MPSITAFIYYYAWDTIQCNKTNVEYTNTYKKCLIFENIKVPIYSLILLYMQKSKLNCK